MLSMILLTAVLAAPQEPPVTAPEAQPPDAPAASPAAAEDHIAAGLKQYRRRRFAQAEAHFRQAVEADPASAAAEFYLGYAIYKRAEPRRPNSPGKQESAQHFAKAYELDPAFKPAWGPRT